jgi:methyl-accepting chemotaxis protein
MTDGNTKNIRPRYLVALAIMALACATIVVVSIRSSEETTKIGFFSDAVSKADFELDQLAQMAVRLTSATAEASRTAYRSAIGTRITETRSVLDNLEAAWTDLPDRLKERISGSSYASGAEAFKTHWDLLDQGSKIFGGDAASENQNATRLASTYRLLNLPMTKEYQKIVRDYSKDAAEAVARFNYGFAGAGAVILIGLGLFIFLPMERTIKRQIVQMAESLEEVRAVGRRAARVRSALDDASSSALIVDPEGTVTFSNKAMIRLAEGLADNVADALEGFNDFRETGQVNPDDYVEDEAEDEAEGEADGRAEADSRSAATLAGMEFDRLHSLDAMRSERLMMADEPVSARMVVGGQTLELTASPVFDEEGARLGSVVEWKDLTEQVAVEREIAGIVHYASDGDFSKRLTEADKIGFMADLAKGMNEVLNVVDNGLSQAVRVVSALAEGDLTERMQGEHKGAFGMLKGDIDSMAKQMEAMLGRIAEVSSAVQLATDDISAGITDLSARTEHQASSLEETTASMEELSATVRQNAENAQEANQVAAAARESAVTGGEVADRAVAAMGGIEDSSKKITEIVGLIQEIAFQTNLLALNASVEAARAGEAGRGFAVVANEVRALAQRAASASKDIKELITNSGTQVKEGAQLVNEAGSALEEIVTSVKKVADYVSEIASASQEQTSGIDQVSSAISGMDEMTQQNAALVEETTAAIQSATSQVSDLQSAVGAFRTTQSFQTAQAGDDERGEAQDDPAGLLHDMAARMADQPQDAAPGENSDRRFAASGTGLAIDAVTEGEWEEF